MIIRYPLSLSNAFLIHSELPVLIDTGSPGDYFRLEKLLKKQGLLFQELGLIVLTHAHPDHAGTAAKIKETADIPVIIQENDLEPLINGQLAPSSATGPLARIMLRFGPSRYPGFTPEMIFADEMDLSFWRVKGRLIHTPGHTAGSCSVVLDSGDAIIGDLLMGGFFGGYLFPWHPGKPYGIQNKAAMLQSIQKLLDLDVQRFYVGHGGVLSRKQVATFLKKQLPR